MSADRAVPVVSDVTVRISADGAMIGFDFESRDGSVRTLALPAEDLSKLLAGCLWAGGESAARRAASPTPPSLREQLRDGARTVSDWRIVDEGGEQFLEVTVGAAFLCLRLPSRV